MLSRVGKAIVAGIGANVLTTVVTQPFDLIRSRHQSAIHQFGKDVDGQPRSRVSVLQAAKSIVKEEGVCGLYRGLGIHLFGHVTSAAAYYGIEAVTKQLFGVQGYSQASDEAWYWRAGRRFCASSTAGVLQVMMTHPVWVVKARVQNSPVRRKWTEVVKEMMSLTEMYSGVKTSIYLTLHSSAQFALYEEIKRAMRKNSRTISPFTMWVAATTSKAVSMAISNPLTVLRVRQIEAKQDKQQRDKIAGELWKKEGTRGFYRGIAAAVYKSCVTGSALTLFDLIEASLLQK